MAHDTKTDLRNKVIYSIYVRNYSEEGNFTAVERDLDRIKALGVIVGEHKKIQGTQRLVGIFSFEGKNGSVETGLKDGIYKNLADGKIIQVRDGKIELQMCPVIIEQ